MVGSGRKTAETVREAVTKAGALVVAALAIACVSLVTALVSLVLVLRVRRA